jgi:hypothetical protein
MAAVSKRADAVKIATGMVDSHFGPLPNAEIAPLGGVDSVDGNSVEVDSFVSLLSSLPKIMIFKFIPIQNSSLLFTSQGSLGIAFIYLTSCAIGTAIMFTNHLAFTFIFDK